MSGPTSDHDRAESESTRPAGHDTGTARETSNSWGPVLTLQRQAGNAAVTDYLALGAQIWEQGQALSAEAAQDTEAAGYADAVYTALDGYNSAEDISNALWNLSGNGPARRVAIQIAFRNKYGTELEDYLVSQLDGDDRVNALAYLWSDNTQGYHVALARALISYGVRESEPLRILAALPLQGRQRVEMAYDAAYAKVGEGSLKADLADQLEDEVLQECLVLLDHDVTPAERLYLDSVAVSWGTKTEKVVAQIRDVFKSGADKLSAMDIEWTRMVVGHKGDDQQWTKMSMTEALYDELSGESWLLVKACLDGMQAWRAGKFLSAVAGVAVAAGAEVVTDHTSFTVVERAQLVAAEGTINASVEGFGTNVGALNEALSTARSIYDARRARAVNAGASADILAMLDAEWAKKKTAYIFDAEWDTSGAAEQAAHLALAGDLTFADRLYLAQRERDSDKAVKVADDCWIAGKVEELHTDANKTRPERVAEGEEPLRPVFNPIISVFTNENRPFQRIKTVLDPSEGQDGRGSIRLWYELSLADGDEELKTVTAFLTPVPKPLLNSVLTSFMAAQTFDVEPDAHPERRFALWVIQRKRFNASTECWNLAAVVDPLTNYKDAAKRAQVAYERAQGRHDALHSGYAWGLTDWLWTEDQREEDAESGEDLVATEEESLARLKFISEQAANPQSGSLDQLIGQTGGKGIGDLAAIEAGLFTERAEELRKAKVADVERLVFIAQLVVDAAATAFTGGGYAAAILVAMASSAAGMSLKEVMLGDDYELLDADNAIELAASAVGAVVSKKFANVYEKSVGGKAALDAIDQPGAIKGAVIERTGEIIGETGVNAAFAERLPTDDEIVAKMADILVKLGSSAGGKGVGWTNSEMGERAAFVRKHVLSHLTKNGVEALGTASVSAAKAGSMGQGTGWEWVEGLGTDFFKKTVKSFNTAVADAIFPDKPDGWGAGSSWVADKVGDWATQGISLADPDATP